MTAQASEQLIYQGERLSLCTHPLAPFLKCGASPLRFHAPSSALWRGYIGTWAIERERLYLVQLDGYVQHGQETDGFGTCKVGLDALFAGYPDGVFAHWFTGELRCPAGALLHYEHAGYASRYERDLFIDVRQGLVLGQREVVNGTASPDAAQG